MSKTFVFNDDGTVNIEMAKNGILVKKVVEKESILSEFNSLLRVETKYSDSGSLPPSVRRIKRKDDRNFIVYSYQEPTQRNLITSQGIKIDVGIPALIGAFVISDGYMSDMGIWCLNSKYRISDNAPLYYFPYGNVLRGNTYNVCLGNLTMPKVEDPLDTWKCWSAYWNSEFTGDGDSNAFTMMNMMEKKPFDDKLLVPFEDKTFMDV